MAYKLTFGIKNKYIHVTAAGSQTLRDNMSLATACIDACVKNNLRFVLLDITGLTGQPGTMADYELAKLLDAWDAGKVVQRAALFENEADLAAGKFFETAARNRNINLAVFTDINDAEEWLLNG